MKPTTLKSSDLEKILSAFSKESKRAKLIKYLAKNPKSSARQITDKTGLTNIRDTVNQINLKIIEFGFFIAVESPVRRYKGPRKNEWSFFEVK